jgi:hypothetical protein
VTLPDPNGTLVIGKAVISATNDVQPILISVPNCAASRLEVALWWPEKDAHNDIDLEILSPPTTVEGAVPRPLWTLPPVDRPCNPFGTGGQRLGESRVGPDVFERASVIAPPNQTLSQGPWTVNIIGYDVPSGPQTVYFAATLQP